jgi:hypothetical protein
LQPAPLEVSWQVIGPRWHLSSFRLQPGQSLGEPYLEFGSPFVKRAIEEIVHHIQPACFVRLELINIAVFENAGSERKLLCGMVDQQRAFHELATIIAEENAFAPKIKIHA